MLTYRYASEIPEIAVTADKMIAGGIILASIAFWIAYSMLKTKHIESFNTFFYKHSKNDDDEEISSQKFWIWIWVFFVSIVLYYLCQYLRFGNFESMFFQNYNQSLQIMYSNDLTISFPILLRISNRIINYFFYVSIYFSIALLFESLRKNGNLKGMLPIIIAFFLSIISMTGLFFTGFRTYTGICFYIIFLMTIVSLFNRDRRLLKISVPIIIFLLFYSLFWMTSLTTFRLQGINGLRLEVLQLYSKENTEESIKSLAVIPKEITVPENIHFDMNNLSPDKFKNNKETNSEVQEIAKKDITTNNTQTPFTSELTYLQSVRTKYGHSMSKEIAWVMLYYGRHTKYLGITYGFRTLLNDILPPPLGKDHSIKTIGRLIFQSRDVLGGGCCGQLGEGYACYGIIGAYLYVSIWAFIGGLMAKFAIINLFIIKSRLEFIALSLLLVPFVAIILCQGYGLFYFPFVGFLFILFLTYFLTMFFSKIIKRNYQ
jgi:hypothetical protein